MKKFLAIILALVMCASIGMVAFAEAPAPSVSTDTDETAVDTTTEDGDGINTEVDILVTTNNISVTVPLKVVLVADVGGGQCQKPDNYAITNYSAIPVEISAAAAADKENDEWLLVAADPSAVLPGTDDENQIQLTFTADSVAWNLAETYAGGWNIDAAADENGAELPITIAAYSSKLNTTDKASAVVTVTYTVEAA